MVEARGLTKRYGDTTAVDDLTFTVRPGVVTGFLGPNRGAPGRDHRLGDRADWRRRDAPSPKGRLTTNIRSGS